MVILLCNTGIPEPLTGLGLGVRLSLRLDSERAGDPRHTLASGDLDPDLDPDLDLDLDSERNPRSLSTSRSRSGDAPESESRLRCFASTGSMLRPTDALLAPVLVGGVDPVLMLGTGLVLGVGGVVGAGVSFAVSEEDAEVVKRESLDSPRGIVPVLESVCAWLASCSCPSWALALDSDADTEVETDIVIDMELSRCSKNRESWEHVFPSRGLQAIDPSNGVDATRRSRSDGDSGVSTLYFGRAGVSLNGVPSLPVTSLDAGVSESELVLDARSERRIMVSGVWNDGASMSVFLEMSESGPGRGPVERHCRMGENAERRKGARVVCVERLEAAEGMRRRPFP